MNTDSQKGSSNVLVFFLGLLLIALTGVSVYFWQSYEKEKAINDYRSSNPSRGNTPNYVVNTENNYEKSDPVVETKKVPVVIYTPNGLFTEPEIVEVKKKLIAPFIDWSNENSQNTVSISVEKPNPVVAGYTYKVTYINESGSNGGFLYGMQTPLEWWLPECYGGCNFSAEFKAKYPEIVAKLTP